jgi:hypothetical protein
MSLGHKIGKALKALKADTNRITKGASWGSSGGPSHHTYTIDTRDQTPYTGFRTFLPVRCPR